MDKVATWAGTSGVKKQRNGFRTDALFREPSGIAVDDVGNVFVCDKNCVRKINGRDGKLSSLIQRGQVISDPKVSNGLDSKSTRVRFKTANDIASSNGELFISHGNSTIIHFSKDGTLTLLAGSPNCKGHNDGMLLQSTFSNPWCITADKEGQNLFVAEVGNGNKIRMISLINGTVTTIEKSGIVNPSSVVCHHRTGDLFVIDSVVKRMSRVSTEDGIPHWSVTTVPIETAEPFTEIYAVAVYGDALFLISWNHGLVVQSSLDGKAAKVIAKLRSFDLTGVAANATGVYVTHSNSGIITKITHGFWWSPHNHRLFGAEQRKLVGTIMTAHSSFNAQCQLRKMPREIVLHVLTFLNNQSL
jgi:hypothetical protein